MATWMAHLRIADGILDKMQGLEATEFIVGNIALDSGVPTPDVLSWLLRPLVDRYFVGTGDCFFIKRKRRRGISKNPQETIWKWKGDWYDLDFLYLKQHPDFRSFQIYENAVGFENMYLDFFAKDAFDNRRQYITSFYHEQRDNLKRDYIWLTQERMNAFVTYAAEIVLEKNNMIK